MTTMHYVDWTTFDGLVRLAESIRLADLPASRGCSPELSDIVVSIDARDFKYEVRCQDDETRRLMRLARAIEGSVWTERGKNAPKPSCWHLRTIPEVFRVKRGDHQVEVRYVDWLP